MAPSTRVKNTTISRLKFSSINSDYCSTNSIDTRGSRTVLMIYTDSTVGTVENIVLTTTPAHGLVKTI